jgi:DNA-binding IclR family transcriptional regulator
VKSATRALNIVEFVAVNDGVSLTDVMRALEIPRSSAHGLIKTLEASKWLRRERSGLYKLGGRAWILGRSNSVENAWMGELNEVLSQITRETKEAAQFSILDGTECVYMAVQESPQPMSLYSRIGSRLHAHATAAGKAMYSLLDPEEYERSIANLQFQRMTDRTITDREDFDKAIDEVRRRGYATDIEEYVPNSICVSSAVDLRDSFGFLGAISITMPRHRQPESWPEGFLPTLRAAVSRIGSGGVNG